MLLMQCFAMLAFSQYSITGTVIGKNNQPLIGANAVIKNSFNGMSTDSKGSFEFKNLKAGNYDLVISFIGYEKLEKTIEVTSNQNLKLTLTPSSFLTEEVIVAATRAKNNTPTAFSTISSEELTSRNLGQDIPYLMQLTPSFVATSDGGAGVGYTNFRIRGTDLNRINVTVDGIPYNDAESHGTFFVDVPDLAGSTENIQIQRGVGTSTNGAAAFGASINIQTNHLQKDAYAAYSTAFGSFGTFRNSVSAGTGLMNEKFTVDARLSKVSSNGYIDRASSNLKSFFVSAGYFSENTIIKANIFSGFEETYQAWNGVPSVRLNNDVAGMQQYGDHWLISEKQTLEMINSDSRTYNLYTYENEVDHYQQDHFQLHLSHKIDENLSFNTSLHYTYGRGYYENYKDDKKLADYNISTPETVGLSNHSDLVVRKWLVNDFYGLVSSLNYKNGAHDLTIGGGWNTYDGDHFGKVIWGQYLGNATTNHEWYRGTGLKKDFNMYTKYNLAITNNLNLYADLQYRHITHTIKGIDDDLRDITQEHSFNFLNPKIGLYYKPAANQELFVSFAQGHREPNRGNYVDADPSKPEPVYETLNDFESGYNFKTQNVNLGAVVYYMNYKDQLVLTGEINDVGAPIMINADKSYRAGIELMAGCQLSRTIKWQTNATISQNKIKNFTEYVDNWDTWGQEAYDLGTTDIAFSPGLTANNQLQFLVAKNLNVNFISTYVSKQFIDNTSNDNRSLDAYFVNNLEVNYNFTTKLFHEIKLHLQVNNLFNEVYESNAWVYSYMLGGERYKMDGYFPQAGTNFMFGIDFKF